MKKNKNKIVNDLEDLSSYTDKIIEGDFKETSLIESTDDLSFMNTDLKIKNLINSHLDIYNKKHGTSISFESMEENIKAISLLNKIEKSELQAVFGDHIATSSFLIEYKAAITMLNYFDKFLNSVSNNEQVNAEEFSAGILNSILNFIPKINKLREQYSVNNIDRILGKNNKDISEKIKDNKEFLNIKNELSKPLN